MKPSDNLPNGIKKGIDYFMNTKNWWGPLLFILIISLAGVGMIGYQTYHDAPPMEGFKSQDGTVLLDKATIERGQVVFHKYALMEYGSFFGDGAQRGPDYTAEALHQITRSMIAYKARAREKELGRPTTPAEQELIEAEVRRELKKNTVDPKDNLVVLSPDYVLALKDLERYYLDVFLTGSSKKGSSLKGYLTREDEIRNLAGFFFWGGWVCVTERPGEPFSYTHN